MLFPYGDAQQLVDDNRKMLLSTLQNFLQTDVNFVDAYHAAIAAVESVGITSFDRDFDQFSGIKRIELARLTSEMASSNGRIDWEKFARRLLRL